MKNSTTKPEGVYINTNVKFLRPIFGIDKINKTYLVLFYIYAWGITPSLLNRKQTKKATREMVADTARAFRWCANKAGIYIARSAAVEKYLQICWQSSETGTPGFELAKRLYYLYFNVPKMYHDLYIPVVKEAISRYSKGDMKTALKIINGPSTGGIL